MCGIAGIFSKSPEDNRGAIGQMSSAMENRGPDDEGFLLAQLDGEAFARVQDTMAGYNSKLPYHSTVKLSEGPIHSNLHIAQRRLSIIDLSPNGHQPLCDQTKRYWIAYNGEVYNFKEVRKELEQKGVSFFGETDSEVVLQSFIHWGEDCLSKFNGMFAFAIWDQENGELFLARDRIGIKPLYYYLDESRFIFASDIKTLLSSGLVPREINYQGLYHSMGFGLCPRPMTAFEGVRAIRQAHFMRVDRQLNIVEKEYWSIPDPEVDHSMTLNQGVEELDQLLTESIRKRLIADVPVATFMSGGVDSTTVASIASRLHPGITAFTLDFEGSGENSEVEQAKRTAAKNNMNHVIRVIEPSEMLNHIEDMIVCFEEPFCALDPNYIISKIVHDDGYKVVLNGLGGDELFSGYVYYSWENRWKLLKATRPLWTLSKYALPFTRHLIERLDAVALAEKPEHFPLAIRTFMPDDERKRLMNGKTHKDWDSISETAQNYFSHKKSFKDFQQAVSYMDLMNYIGNHHVFHVDQFTMRFSLEARVPFLDHNLVEFAMRVPPQLKIAKGQRKYLLREVAKKYIDQSCLDMKKKGFRFPNNYWMKGPLKSYIDESLDSLASRDIFKESEIRRIHKDWQRGVRTHRGMWELVTTEVWMRKFIDS